MQTAIKISTTVSPGNRIEIISLELSEGQRAEVTIADNSVPSYRRYPSAIEAEYADLIEKNRSYTFGRRSLSFARGEGCH